MQRENKGDSLRALVWSVTIIYSSIQQLASLCWWYIVEIGIWKLFFGVAHASNIFKHKNHGKIFAEL